MSEIIDVAEFDRIFDRIVHPEKLHMNMIYMPEAQRKYYAERFLKENCYTVQFDNQTFYILTDAFISMHKSISH